MSLGWPVRPRKQSPSPSSLIKRGTSDQAMFLLQRAPGEQRCWARFLMRNAQGRGRISSICRAGALAVFFLASLTGCAKHPDASTLVVIIESSPANLDPRIGTDAQSERLDELIFDPLVRKDDHFNIQPGVADSWEQPDAQTYIFHLHRGIRF